MKNNDIVATALLAALLAAGPALANDDYRYATRPGDTLISIGRQLLARPADWRRLKTLNRIADPRRMRNGTVLRIPLRLLRRDPVEARVVAVRGDVRDAGARLAPGTALSQGALLTTGIQSFATIELVDGSRLTLQPSSRLRLEELARLRNTHMTGSRLKLEQGRIESIVSRLVDGPHNRYVVSTPGATLGVRGTRFRVGIDPEGGQSRAEVTEGAVDAEGAGRAGKPARIADGYGLVIAADGARGEPVALLPAPDARALPKLQERIVVRFAVPPVAGARAYRFQVGADAQMRAVLAEAVSEKPEAKFGDLADGDYVVRLRAIDGQGLEGRDADAAFRLKARPEAPFAIAPTGGTKLRAETVELSWSQAAEAARYRIQLAADPGFARPLADVDNVAGTALTPAGKLAPGDYHWRARSIRASGDIGPWGDAQRFVLKPLPADPEPPKIDDDTLAFAWSGEPGQRFLFQFARDPGFAKPIAEHRLDTPRVTLPRPEGGTYHMRVQATDPDGFVGPFTRPQSIVVPDAPTPWWPLLFLLLLL